MKKPSKPHSATASKKISRLGRLRKLIVTTPIKHAVVCATAMLFLYVAFGSNGGSIVRAAWVQDDWTGGVGTGADQYSSASNINDSVAGQLTLVNNNLGNWCNDPGVCDSNWSRRQIVTLENQGDAVTNQSVLLFVDYQDEMNSDFSDLRFTDSSGTVLTHYVLDKTDSDKARVWIETGAVASEDTYLVYMYFGNSGASDTSDDSFLLFEDGFDQGNSVKWSDIGGFSPSVSNGAIELRGAQGGYDWVGSVPTFDPTTGAKQVLLDVEQIDKTCDNDYLFGVSVNHSGQYFEFDTASSTDCENRMRLVTNNPGSVVQSADNLLANGQKYTYKVTVNEAGEHDYFYSTDEGRTFARIANVDVTAGANTNPFRLEIFAVGGSRPGPARFSNITVTDIGSPFKAYFGLIEHQGGKTGFLESAIFDTGGTAHFGNIEYTTSGSGHIFVQVRSASNADMSDASPWHRCPGLASGSSMDANNDCVDTSGRYAQYIVGMSADSTNSFQLNSISINYIVDDAGPTAPTNLQMRRQNDSGPVVSAEGWINALPYAQWSAAADVGEAGTVGYCLYVGTNEAPDLSTTAGELSGSGNLDVDGACAYARDDTSLPSDTSLSSSLQNGSTYYIIVAGIDAFGNIGASSSTSFKFDNQPPTPATLASVPIAVSSKIFNVTWVTGGGSSLFDGESGPAGLKYCVTNALLGFAGCDPSTDSNFYGLQHTSGRVDDTSDVVPFANGQITTVAADASRLDDAVAFANKIRVIAIDQAGNSTTLIDSILIITHAPGQVPENLVVNPPSSSTNSFSFTWDPPTTHVFPTSDLNYCWTVNEVIATDGSNCNWTGKGITQLAAGAYATQQGTNTFRIATDDVPGTFDGSQSTSITFTASTTAPGAPQDVDISDVSTRATSSWKLALSWAPPTLPGSGVNSYRIYRSTDGATYSQVGSTSGSNTSFVDSGLSQVDYYYKVKACDNAANCGIDSSVVTLKPTGRFTEPANLTADTDQPKVKNIGTKGSTVYWFTDRDSDSKVAYGTSPGQYGTEEVGNSAQVATHEVTLSNLQPNTTYYYIAKWTDRDGNTGQSQERSFTTAPPPTVSEVSPSNVTANSASITFRTKDASKAFIYFGRDTNFGGLETINTATKESTYTVTLRGLTDGARYVFKVNGLDSDGNEYQGNTYTFTTPARPRINNLKFQPVANEPSSTMEVTWNTNVASTSELVYGPAGGQRVQVVDSKLVTEHKVIIRDLIDDTDYNLVATSHDKDNNAAVSDSQRFRTALDTRPPKISDVVVETSVRGNGSQSRGQIIVSWKTDEPATSQVAFGLGEGASLTSKSSEDGRMTLEHTVVVSDIPTSSIYSVAPISTDKGDNATTAESITAIIGRGSENVFNIIFDALGRIFGL